MPKRWTIKPEPDTNQIKHLVEVLNINQPLAKMLVQRGIQDFDTAKDFFRPQLGHLHDPFLMADMNEAVNRLENAMINQEKILVYGDYDVDGTTSVSLMYGFLSTIYPNLDFYIPDRYKEGYGVSRTGIEWAAEQGISLIICLDCGVKSYDLIAFAKNDLNIDFIVCDHHTAPEILPPAVAVLDPKRPDCAYPYKELTGCGVGFKFLQAYCIKNNIPLEKLYPQLDFVATSIACDIVPITGENRAMMFYGLKQINENPRTSFVALKEVAGYTSNNLNVDNVVFGFGPRINAAGRVAHAHAAVNLLLSDNLEEAQAFAEQINVHNTERKGYDSSMTEEALAMIEENENLRQANSTLLYKSDWHKGVVGIVASRCIERYHRPTIILTKSDDKVAGSARSVAGFNLYEAIEACSDLLIQFGGHTHAAGMTLKPENVEAFRKKFETVVSERILPEQLIPQILIDAEISFSDITQKFYKVKQQMAPFGPENMKPVFASSGLKLASKAQILKEKHLKLELVEQSTGLVFTALGFGMAEEFARPLQMADTFSVVYTVEENTFRGQSSLQLYLKDIKI